MKLKNWLFALAAAGCLAANAGSTQAYSIELTPLAPTFGGGIWDYAYNMTLTAGNSLDSQSMFVFFDVGDTLAPFGAFTPGVTSASDWNIVGELTSGTWAASQSQITSQGGTLLLPDLNSQMNVRFQYVGSGLSAGTENATLGIAHLYSTQAPSQNFLAYGARWTDDATGKTNVNSDTPPGPGPQGGTGAPEPASLGILGVGAAAFMMRRRR